MVVLLTDPVTLGKSRLFRSHSWLLRCAKFKSPRVSPSKGLWGAVYAHQPTTSFTKSVFESRAKSHRKRTDEHDVSNARTARLKWEQKQKKVVSNARIAIWSEKHTQMYATFPRRHGCDWKHLNDNLYTEKCSLPRHMQSIVNSAL